MTMMIWMNKKTRTTTTMMMMMIWMRRTRSLEMGVTLVVDGAWVCMYERFTRASYPAQPSAHDEKRTRCNNTTTTAITTRL